MKNARKENNIVKTDFKFPDVTIAKFDGAPEEIYLLFEKFQKNIVFNKAKIKKSSSRRGPQQRIRELIENGFFKERRTINDVQKKLEGKGHIYENNQLSPALKRLVDGQELRRVKEDKKWNYVNS